MPKVLITGMTGLIGGLLREHLESLGGYELSALNRRPIEGVECHQADIADLDAIRPTFENKDVVVHLAAALYDDMPWNEFAQANLIGPRNVYEAARLARVKRVIFASSGFTIRGFESVSPYNALVAGEIESLPPEVPKITHEQA